MHLQLQRQNAGIQRSQLEAAMPSVFISYRQTDDAQLKRVRSFAEELRRRGIDVVLDQFFLEANPAGPNDGWDVWSTTQALESTRVLVVGTEDWFACFDKRQPAGTGLGAACEATVIRHRIHRSAGRFADIRVVLFDDADAAHIPPSLSEHHRFHAGRDLLNIVRWVQASTAEQDPANEPGRRTDAGAPPQPPDAPPKAPTGDRRAALVKNALDGLAEIEHRLVDDQDTRTASAELREWKKRIALMLGSEEIYGIEADDDRKGSGPYGELRNVMKKCRRFLQGLA